MRFLRRASPRTLDLSYAETSCACSPAAGQRARERRASDAGPKCANRIKPGNGCFPALAPIATKEGLHGVQERRLHDSRDDGKHAETDVRPAGDEHTSGREDR